MSPTGGYGSTEAMGKMIQDLESFENDTGVGNVANRIYYFAIPPNVFLDTASSIKQVGISATGFTRLVVEKPFGRDYDSAMEVSQVLCLGRHVPPVCSSNVSVPLTMQFN